MKSSFCEICFGFNWWFLGRANPIKIYSSKVCLFGGFLAGPHPNKIHASKVCLFGGFFAGPIPYKYFLLQPSIP